MGVEHWRARKYLTSGALYWQLNDSWPVISWSSIDYFKRPKALYYYTKRFFDDILPVIVYYNDSKRLLVVSDLKKSARVEFEIMSLGERSLLKKEYDTYHTSRGLCGGC
jgi:beta-mannosidase  (EC 3.2.1.25)